MVYDEKWKQGEKHPETPKDAFANCWEYDRVRRLLSARCKICDYVVSKDDAAVKELIFVCDNSSCHCHDSLGSKAHQVCDLCYHMWRAIYANYTMKNSNYFRDIDEKIKSDFDRKRRNSGL